MPGIGALTVLIGLPRIMMKKPILVLKDQKLVSYVINAERKKKMENVHNQTQKDSFCLS